ncbi:MAG TPA: chromosomal replication initiator protein DnaA [Baekduia sp.]|nr:chromosomal replication initiator protein DnaA [Baekduia sp.]
MSTPEPDIWQRFQTQLQLAADSAAYDVWLAPLRYAGYDGRVLSLTAPAEHRAWIASRFMALLDGAAADVIGDCEVVLLDEVAATEPKAEAAPPAVRPAPSHLNPAMTFDQFVIGEANRFGHAAALAVAESPGTAYNPLFIYGPPGVGKSHLLHAIGNYATEFGGGISVHCTTAETFTSDFVSAVKGDGIAAFKGRYRSNDVLLIDDIQFLQSKARTEEEFFHTFNALQDAGAQIVVTSDRPPDDLEGLQERLRARFGSGLLVDVRNPDPAIRRLVLRKRIQHDELSLAEAEPVIELICERVTKSIRALEGALIRIAAYASLQGRPIDLDLTTEVLDRLYAPSVTGRTAPTIATIQQAVAATYGIEVSELVSGSRTARLAWPRQVAMYLCREHTSETLPAIGRQFGGRDHTTVMYACKKTNERLASDSDQYEVVRALTERILNRS